jgi:hypothetical protein
MDIIYALFGLVILDAAMLWGADSRDGTDSPEWRRRKEWRGFGGTRR